MYMEEFFKKTTIINLIASLLFLGIGIILATNPVITLNIITYVVEIVLMLWGIIAVINYIKVDSKYDAFGFGFVQAVICILLALFLIINSNIIISILPICIGIFMIFGSLARIQVAIKLNALGQRTSILYILLAILMFTIGIVIVYNPFTTAAIIIQALGIAIISYSIIDIIEGISIVRFLNRINV